MATPKPGSLGVSIPRHRRFDPPAAENEILLIDRNNLPGSDGGLLDFKPNLDPLLALIARDPCGERRDGAMLRPDLRRATDRLVELGRLDVPIELRGD